MSDVVFIAGYGRSGSTILDVLLGSHPKIFGAGELVRFFDYWHRDIPCSCGQPLHSCDFWSQVITRFSSDLPNISPKQAWDLTLKVDAGLNLPRLIVGHWRNDEKLYGDIWSTLLNIITDVSGSPIVLDSTKNTRGTYNRPLALARICKSNVKVIHLVRDPRAVTWSTLRGSNRRLEEGKPAHIRGGPLRVIPSWMLANGFVHVLQRIESFQSVRLRYEDLVNQTSHELTRVADALDIDLQPVISVVEQGRPLVIGHGIAGNRLRRGGVETLRFDEDWKSNLPRAAHFVVMMSWPLMIKYGYKPLST